MQEKILILDFGSQYTQLIARRIREMKIFAEIHPYNTPTSKIKGMQPAGIILSGGPSSVYDKDAPGISKEIFNMGVPVLGICYGLQLMATLFGGKVAASKSREYGKASLKKKKRNRLFDKMSQGTTVWMSHGDKVELLPEDFEVLAVTDSSPFAAIGHRKKPFVGVQFHPEVQHTRQGRNFLAAFCTLCNVKKNWTMKNFARQKIEEIRATVGTEKVLLGLSGGVDSTVTAKILHDAIGDQLTCVYVDTGLMRKGETEAVQRRFTDYFKIRLETVLAEDRFLDALKGVTDPEQKRKIIGRLFVEEFRNRAAELGHHEFLAQGTLYTDVIESVSVKGPSETIKSHHNRVQEILDMMKAGRVIEPLNELFKDEVRALGAELDITAELLQRHPFPGPGLAIRILGEVNRESLELLREADAILLDELKKNGYYHKTWQAFAVLLNVRSVGVMGDQRTYENAIALRMVESQDGMTADFARVPHELLGSISNRIINEIRGINRVVYDISSKPPATIEWE